MSRGHNHFHCDNYEVPWFLFDSVVLSVRSLMVLAMVFIVFGTLLSIIKLGPCFHVCVQQSRTVQVLSRSLFSIATTCSRHTHRGWPISDKGVSEVNNVLQHSFLALSAVTSAI